MSRNSPRDIAPDLDAAVEAGVLDRDSGQRLLAFLQTRGSAQAIAASADEEQLRLITGFNDIFVTIGLALFLGALSFMLTQYGSAASAAACAAASWLLAEFFTRKKRMALPSIVLLLVFVISVMLSCYALLGGARGLTSLVGIPDKDSVAVIISALAAAAAAAAHWFRFQVPITVAAGFGAAGIMVIAVVASISPGLVSDYSALVFIPIGLAAFALAMRFDMSDRQRLTRRTDIAFWLHLLAAPIIVHPLIVSLGLSGQQGPGEAVTILVIFGILCLVALVIDRRAVLVSSLGYLAYAAFALTSAAGWALGSAFGILLVGTLVLLLSAAWRPLRDMVLRMVPDAIAARVPPAAALSEKAMS